MIELINDDCITTLQGLEPCSVACIVTDPPYKTTARGNSGTMGGYWKTNIAKSGNIFKHNDIKPSEYLPLFYRVLKEDSHCYVMCNNKNLIEMLNSGVEAGFKFVKNIIWDKGNKICGRYYMGAYEYIIMFRKGKDKPINNCGTPDILSVPIKKLKSDDGKNLHDTEKPIKLMEILIENSTDEGDLVLDPFMGIGSTPLACKNLKRKCIAIEIDKEYFSIAEERNGQV